MTRALKPYESSTKRRQKLKKRTQGAEEIQTIQTIQNNNNKTHSNQKGNRQYPPKPTSKFPSGNSTGSKRSASGRGVVNDSLSVDSETIVTDDELLDLTLVQDQQSDGDHGQENSIDQELPASTHVGTPEEQYVQMVDLSQTH